MLKSLWLFLFVIVVILLYLVNSYWYNFQAVVVTHARIVLQDNSRFLMSLRISNKAHFWKQDWLKNLRNGKRVCIVQQSSLILSRFTNTFCPVSLPFTFEIVTRSLLPDLPAVCLKYYQIDLSYHNSKSQCDITNFVDRRKLGVPTK